MPPRVEGQLSDAIISGLSDPVIGIDRVGRVRVFNEQAGKVMNVVPGDAIGKMIWEVVSVSELSRAFTSQIKDTNPTPVEQVMVFPDNRVFAARVTAVRTAKGRNLGAIAILRDMAGVQKIERGIDQIMLGLSRRVAVPLTAIKGCVETLLDGACCDLNVTRRFLQMINEDANRLVRLVMTLDEALSEDGLGVLEKSKCRIEDLVRKSVDLFVDIAASKNVSIRLEIASDLPWVELDTSKMNKAFVNLVDNAIRFTGVKGGGTVIVRVEQYERDVVVEVCDDGIGIPHSEQSRVFERFYRGSSPEVVELGGTGLGLSVAYEIIEGHGGTLEVQSEPGVGSTFRVTLPIRRNLSAQATATPPAIT